MKHSWVPYAAITAGAALLAEAVITISSDDEVLSGATTVMFDVGVLLAVAAAVGYALGRERRRALVGIGLVLAILAWVTVVGDLLTPLFEVFSDSDYLGDEGPMAILGVVLLALGARAKIVDREPALA
jgi:uncharacterized protein (TIGR03382 family)